jgi:hypothetical protein
MNPNKIRDRLLAGLHNDTPGCALVCMCPNGLPFKLYFFYIAVVN